MEIDDKNVKGILLIIICIYVLGILTPGFIDNLSAHNINSELNYYRYGDEFINGTNIYNMTHDEFKAWLNLNFKYDNNTECEFYSALWKHYLDNSEGFERVTYIPMKETKHMVILAERKGEYCIYDQLSVICTELAQ